MERYELLVQVAGYENTNGIILTSHLHTYGASYSVGDILQINGGLIDAFVRVDSLRNPSGFSINILTVDGSGHITSSSLNTGGAGYIAGDIFIVNGPPTYAIGVIDTVGGSGNVLTYHLTSTGAGYVIGTETTVLSPLSSNGVLTYTILSGGYGYTVGGSYTSLDTTGSGSGFSLIVDSLEYSNIQALDTFGDNTQVSIPLNYNIADINNIASKNSSYSKSISIPDTKVNRQVFRYIFDLNADSLFDPTKKSKCWVLKDTVIQFEGNLQMVGITYDRKTFKDTYECVIYADNDTLFTNIGEKYLNELDLSAYNHNYNNYNIINSWSRDYTNGYYYPLMDLGGDLDYGSALNNLNTTDFYPALYLKTIFDRIFTEAGYSYTSDFLNSDFFKKLIIPFNNAALLPSTTSINPLITNNNLIFEAGLSATQSITSGSQSGNVQWCTFGFDIDIYDPNTFYNTTNHVYTSTFELVLAQRFSADLTFVLGNSTFPGTPWTGIYDDVLVYVKRSYDLVTGLTVSGWSDTPTETQLISGGWPSIPIAGQDYWSLRNSFPLETNVGGGNFTLQQSFNTDYLNGATPSATQPLRAGEQVRFFFVRYGFAGGLSPTTAISTTDNSGSVISSSINPMIMGINFGLSASSFISQNIKQKDLLTSVIKLFNLYMEPNKNSANNFIIEPRDQYYSKYQIVKDWTEKLDLNQPIISDVLSNTQVRRNIFTYKEDKDFWNTEYTKLTGQIAGQYEWVINNDFISSDVNNIQPIFSPTILDLIVGSNNIYAPTITTQQVNGKFNGMNIRLLYKNLLPLSGGDQFKFNGYTYSTYPYAGPYDDPLNPTIDLNFGYTPAFYPNMVATTNNLFYNYYQDQMVLIGDKNSRIITAHFNLTSVDISQFKFSDLIFFRVDGSEGYYRVNKIVDYDPSQNASTQVELITAQNYNII